MVDAAVTWKAEFRIWLHGESGVHTECNDFCAHQDAWHLLHPAVCAETTVLGTDSWVQQSRRDVGGYEAAAT